MDSTYGQFCPVSMAAEIVCSRWTLLVVRELLCGSTRFNDLRRGVPRMSPALLSKRLKELEHAGVVKAVPAGPAGTFDYRLTAAGEDLRTVVMGLGRWGHRWVDSEISLKNLDPSLLMWDIRRNIDTTLFPDRRTTIQFLYPELEEARRRYWLVVEAGTIDLCTVDHGYDVDLYVKGSLRVMTSIWMGFTSLSSELASGALQIDGDPAIARTMQSWLGLSHFAREAAAAKAA